MSMGWTNDLCHLKILLIFWRLYIHTHTCIKLIMILPVGMSNRYGQCLQIWSGDSILWRFWLSRWSICPERFLWGEYPSLTCQNVLCSYTLSDWICKYRMIHLLTFDVYSLQLEYTLDLTKEGYASHQHGHQHSYYGGHDNHGSSGHHGYSYTKAHQHGSSWLSNILTLAVFGIIIYALYATCFSSAGQTGSGDTGGFFGRNTRGSGSAPPPPGFRDDYMPGGQLQLLLSTMQTQIIQQNVVLG